MNASTFTSRLVALMLYRRTILAVVFILFFVQGFFTLDPDFGWHLASGNYFLAHGIPATDIYTYTAPSFPWVDHEWLNDIFVAIGYHVGGFALLATVFAALWTFALWLVGKRIHPLLLLVAAIAVAPFAGVRTVTWSFVFLAVAIWLLQRPGFRKLLLVPVFLLWANMHGSFVFGFFYLGYEAIRRRSWKYGALLLACIAVSFCNPYGWHIYIEIFRTLTDSELRGQIREWRAALFPIATLPFVLLWIGLFAVRSGKQWREYLRLDAITFIASLLSVRTTPLFVLFSLEPLQRRLTEVRTLIPTNLDAKRRRFIRFIMIAVAVLVTVNTIVSFNYLHLDREATYPATALRDLQRTPCSGNLFNDYNYGGYLIWKLPQQKVYIDGRMPSWSQNGDKYIDDYARVTRDAAYRASQFETYDIQCVLIESRFTPMISQLLKSGWTGTTYSDGSTLLRKP